MMANCIKRGELPKSHHAYGKLVCRDQQILVYSPPYSLSPYQVQRTVKIWSQMAMDLHILSAIFISFLVFKALLVRNHELVFFKIVAAEL